MQRFRLLIAAVGLLIGCAGPLLAQQSPPANSGAQPDKTEIAIFAGGCFWCVEADFDKVAGVLSTVSGYIGGTTPNPTYQQVTAGGTGHIEAVQISFDPSRVRYQQLLDVFWKSVDPYDKGGQFCDRGDSYRTAVFYTSDEQKKLVEASKAALQANGPLKQPLATDILEAGTFTKAEEYHQDYYKKNPIRYGYYRAGCGRDARLQDLWGKKQASQ